MTKVLSLIITILGMAITAGAAFTGNVSPQWGLVIGAAIPIAYGVERSLQKILAGATLKSLFSTSEAWGTAIVLLASLGTAISGVVSPAEAGAIMVVAALMLRFGRALQGGAILPSGSVGKVGAVLVLVLGSLLLSAPAQAQTLTPSDVAPPLSFCFGASTTCVVPDSGLQAVNYDLVNKKWSGGITGAGIGYALLFAADTAYASGASVHVTFDFSQSVPSYLAPTFAIVLAHIFELGYTPVFFDGHIGQQITLMIGANAEAIMTAYTGKRLGERLAAKKAEQAASAGAK